MGRFILALALTYIVATGMGMARAHGAELTLISVTTQCGEPDAVHKRLTTKYKEAPIGAGVDTSGKLVSVYINDKTGAWTIIVTSPGGLSCMVAEGEGWRNIKKISLDPEA